MQALTLIHMLLTVPPALTPRPPPAPASAASPSPAALSPDEVKQRVQMYLGTIDVPISTAQWQALGPSAGPVLEAIIDDKMNLPTHRARALGAYVAVSPDRAVVRAQQLALDESEHFSVRLTAISALGRTLPATSLQKGLQPVLTGSRDVRLRARAAKVMAERSHDCTAIRQQIQREAPADREAFHGLGCEP